MAAITICSDFPLYICVCVYIYIYIYIYSWASLVAQLVKNPPAMWETWVRSVGWEDPLEKGKATHSSVLAWRIPWTVYIVHGVAESQTQLTFTFMYIFTVAQMVKNPPAMRETWVRSVGWENPMEKGMATRSSILAWRIPGIEEPGELQSMGS